MNLFTKIRLLAHIAHWRATWSQRDLDFGSKASRIQIHDRTGSRQLIPTRPSSFPAAWPATRVARFLLTPLRNCSRAQGIRSI
jgi:hypothetical protein